MRKPTVRKLFGNWNEPGLSEANQLIAIVAAIFWLSVIATNPMPSRMAVLAGSLTLLSLSLWFVGRRIDARERRAQRGHEVDALCSAADDALAETDPVFARELGIGGIARRLTQNSTAGRIVEEATHLRRGRKTEFVGALRQKGITKKEAHTAYHEHRKRNRQRKERDDAHKQ